MQISFAEPLSRAWERMRRILFEPFELSKWLVLGFSAWLAGLAGSGGGSGTAWNGASEDINRSGGGGLGNALERAGEHLIWLPVIIFAVLVVIAIVLVVLWISSRAKFIFLDNVVHNRAEIVEPWSRFKALGDSLFLWRTAFFAILTGVLLMIAAVIFLPAASMSVNEVLRGLSFAGIFVGILTVMVVGALAFFVLLFLENFVIPIMYKYQLNTTEAWRYFLPWFKNHAGWFVAYGVLFLVAAVAFQILVVALCLVTCCIVLIPYVGTVILLPAWVLYRIYGVEFLAQFHPDFDLFAIEPAVSGAAEVVDEDA
jgi:hypothetical protein